MKTGISFIIFTILVFGCKQKTNVTTNANSQDSIAKYKSTLNWMGHWMGREGKEQMVLQMAREFEFLNQDITVNMQFPQQIFKTNNFRDQTVNEIVKIIQTQKYSWDVVMLDYFNYQSVGRLLNDMDWGRKHLVDFEQFEWFRNSHKPFIFENPKYRNLTGGIYTGPFIEGYYLGLWYNKKLTDRLGLSIKTTGMTFDDFKGYLNTVNEYNKTNSNKIFLLESDGTENYINSIFNTLVLSALGQADTSKVDIERGKEALLKGLKAWDEISQFKPYEKIHSEISVLDQKSLFTLGFHFAYNRWALSNKEEAKNLTVAELPVFDKPGMYYEGVYQSVWAVFKESPQRDNAIRLMKYISSNDIAERWLNTTKNPTGLKSRINTAEFSQNEIDKFNLVIDNKYGKNISTNNNLAATLFGSKNKNISINAVSILKGETTSAEFYKNIVSKIRR